MRRPLRLRRPWEFVSPRGPCKTMAPETMQEVTLPPTTKPLAIQSGIWVEGPYDLTKADPSAGKIDQEETVMLYVAAAMAAIAAALIFLPSLGIERQTTFAAGLSLLGGAATTATRAVSKGGKK